MVSEEDFKILKKEIVFDSWFKVVKEKIQLPDNSTIDYHYMHKTPGVNVLALTPENKIIVVKEYRVPPKKMTFGLPAGIVDEGETPEQAALRELQEETGYTSKEIILLKNTFCVIGMSDFKINLFLAKNCVKTSNQKLDETEFIEVELMNIEDYKNYLIESENIESGWLLAILLAQEKGLI